MNSLLQKQRTLNNVLLLSLLWIKLKENKQRKQRRFWIRNIYQNRKKQGAYFNLLQEMRLNDEEKYYNYLRMSSETFKKLLSIVGPLIKKVHCIREPISPDERLAITLRYLASGDSMMSISYAFRVAHNTVSKIIKETCNALWECLHQDVLLTINEQSWLNIAKDFEERWQLPHCVGAIDGKHIQIQAPAKSGSSFYNYKGSHSIVLMALCDARYRFTVVDIGAEGRHSDGGIFRNSNIGKRIVSNNMCFPAPVVLGQRETPVNFFICADEAFPLSTSIMRPYPGRFLPLPKRIFNYRLSRGRRVIENAFGILAARWRIFRKPIIASESTAVAIVKAAVCLHNFLSNCEDGRYFSTTIVDRETRNGNVIEGEWRNEENSILPIHRTSSNMYGRVAGQMRDTVTEYFMNEGAVSFQWDK